ncbi:putative disease resistance protein (TIR-NBS-LRR class) [Trifolium medium]|uniref:Putative disease resistance protein (TIR-NBS-LRR class) n=1 Tax=Trifolium medium TaxID=97028 RepID=A0A392MYP9_9FABA|nr:putative disease resistance protein (TIR-NBS-LRR class) [Trifolium medium]
MQIIRNADGLYADAVGPLQLVPRDSDQPAETVAEEIPAAEAYGDQTVTARFDAVEVRLEVIEDVMTQIPRGSNSESTDV